MSGMTDNNEFDSIADGMRNDVSEIREMLIHNHDLTAEIRRFREENERLQQELKGIGAEQYYSEQRKNVELRKEVRRLEKVQGEMQKKNDYLQDQNAELAEVLRGVASDCESHKSTYSISIAEYIREVLRKYGLEEEQ